MDLFQLVRLNQGTELLSALDEAKADLNSASRSGQNLLQEAITCKNTELGVELVRRGINVNHQDAQGQTPLHYTAVHKNTAVAGAILGSGGDLSIKDKFGNSPVWTAVFNARGQYELVTLFMKHGGDQNSKNNSGKAAIDFARQIQDKPLISLLESV